MYELQFDLMEWDRFNQSTYFTQYGDDNGTLLSLDPCQDSLKINAVHAQYDLSNYNLNVNGVSQILMSLATVILILLMYIFLLMAKLIFLKMLLLV